MRLSLKVAAFWYVLRSGQYRYVIKGGLCVANGLDLVLLGRNHIEARKSEDGPGCVGYHLHILFAAVEGEPIYGDGAEIPLAEVAVLPIGLPEEDWLYWLVSKIINTSRVNPISFIT